MNYHFIAIGGSAMHNLAIALHKKGETITGSDDEIFDPSKTRLEKYGLLPKKLGWFPEKITSNTDAIVLGMHAKKDNTELAEAKKRNIPIYSYPEFLYEQTKNKKRIVVGGSHGKTTTTAMIMHVLKSQGLNFDYMVGAQIEGFETMVNFSEEADVAVFEGDEYLTSPIDPRPKFHLYKPHVAIITGIAWDHINVFPTFENYVDQFRIFIDQIEKGGTLVYCQDDSVLKQLVEKTAHDITKIPYSTHAHEIKEGKTWLKSAGNSLPLKVFGKHNLQNLSAALLACKQIGISPDSFYTSIKNFTGAAKRLQLLASSDNLSVYHDFAHSPSKLQATVSAVKQQYPEKEIIACMELHTYSSLTESFLSQYKGTLNLADTAIVFYSEHALKLKKLPDINKKNIAQSFGKPGLKVISDAEELKKQLNFMEFKNSILLLLSSGNFSGIDLKKWAKNIVNKII